MEIQGKITTLSHLIYIRPKSMFLVISEGDKHYNVIVRIKSQHLLWKDQLVLRRWIKIDHLKEVSLYSETNYKIHAYTTTEESQLVRISKRTEIPEIIDNNKKFNLINIINYKGEVTDDRFSSSGFYEMDNSITLCLTYMQLVTNIPIIKKGDSIVLNNTHTLRVNKDEVLLFVCGQGNLVNRSDHPENNSLHPAKNRDNNKTGDFLQELALENFCGVALLYSLHQLVKELCCKLKGILPLEYITRASVGANVKGLLACLVKHLSNRHTLVPKSRFFSREIFDHERANCIASAKEPYWKIDYWAANVNEIELRCNQLDLWETCRSGTDPGGSNNSSAKSNYWQHHVANIDSQQGDHISIRLLIGVLSFRNGHWQMGDDSGSIECVAPHLHCNQYCNQLVFATEFVIHREIFTLDSQPLQKTYVSFHQLYTTDLLHVEQSPAPQLNVTYDAHQHVQFLVLNKSLSQRIALRYPDKCHVSGYLLLVSLLRSLPPNGNAAKTPAANEMIDDSMEQAPQSCILVVDHSTVDYPSIIEGQVYQLHLPSHQLLANVVVLASVKDLGQSSVQKHVYRVPLITRVSPVKYSLPKCQSYMRRDVLSAAECLSFGEFSQTVSLRGRIVSRMHSEPRYDSEKSGKSFAIHHETWLGIPGNKQVILKIGDFGATIDVYFNLGQGQNYPCGLCAGTEIELTWLHLRKTQHTGRLYCTSTILTCVRLLKMGYHLTGDEGKAKVELAKDRCIGRRYLSQLEQIRTHDIFNCLVTVRYIHKLAISCRCCGCQSIVTGGVCSYVGCRWSQGTNIDLKAWCTVEDGSAQALLFMKDDCCRRWLKLPANVWKILEEQVLPHQGEFLYLGPTPRYSDGSMAFRILSLYCDAAVHLRRPLHIMTRQFGNSEVNACTTAYYLKEHPSKRLFGLHVEEMDPTSCAIELSGCKRFSFVRS